MRIHTKLMIRLLLVWLFLSTLIGAVVFFIETKKIDSHVVTLATTESQGFIVGKRDDLNSPDPIRRERLYRESMRHIENGHFIAIKLYSRHQEKILEVELPTVRSIEDKMDRHRREMVMEDAVHSRKSVRSTCW